MAQPTTKEIAQILSMVTEQRSQALEAHDTSTTAEVLVQRGVTYEMLKKWEFAISDFDRALEDEKRRIPCLQKK